MAYTAQHLADLKANIARGVTSLEVNGEKVTFRNLDEMQRIVRMIEQDLDPRPTSSLLTPTFSRG